MKEKKTNKDLLHYSPPRKAAENEFLTDCLVQQAIAKTLVQKLTLYLQLSSF